MTFNKDFYGVVQLQHIKLKELGKKVEKELVALMSKQQGIM